MTNEQPMVAQPVLPGDVLVEVVGGEVRFWLARGDAGTHLKVRLVGRSFAFMGERVLQSSNSLDAAVLPKVLRAAPELTTARVYSKKDRRAGALLALAAAAELIGAPAARVHLCYSGCGPSGQRWNWTSDGHYTISA